MPDLTSRKYIRWDADGVESIPPNEKDDIEKLVGKIKETQRQFYEKNGHCFGGTHARTQGIAKGTLSVLNDLPDHLKQTEIFSNGGEYPIVCRYSSEPSDPKLNDTIAQPRGLAMKVFNVEGDMFPAGKDTATQDFEFNSTPALDLADAKTTNEIFDLRLKHGYNTDQELKAVEQRSDAELQKARNQVFNSRLEGITFYSQTAFRFGDYVMKFRLVPSTEAQTRAGNKEVSEEGDGALHERLRDFYHAHNAEYLFQVQLLENIDEQSVEYGGAEWDSDKYPFQTVAKVVIPKQNSWDEDRNRFWVDHMRLDPWHGLRTLQPLGSPNRVRRAVYPESSNFRRSLNGKEEIHVKAPADLPGY